MKKVNFKFKNVLIFGYSKSGKSAEQLLKSTGCKFSVFDKNLKLQGGNYLMKLSKKILKEFDLIVLSPGVSIYNKYIKLAKKLNILVISELELGYWFSDCKIIAITGTNGKTTVTTLITKVLQNAGLKAMSFGNIGVPFSTIINHKNLDYAVVEVSSFQLESLHKFRADLVIILNISEDHINRHKSFENYIKSKLNLLNNANKHTKILLNADDEITMKNIKNYKFFNKNINYISANKKAEGYSLIEKDFYYTNNGSMIKLADLSVFSKLSTYLINVLFILAASDQLNVSIAKTISTINGFKTLNSRLETVANFDAVEYVNDSKATNIHAIEVALNNISKPVFLLLGGQDKKLDFKTFFKNIASNVKYVIAFGEARKKIVKSANQSGFLNIFEFNNLTDAVHFANDIATPNSIVLLSPGCASFDAYSSYKERGEHFKELVNNIKSTKTKQTSIGDE